MNTTTSSGVGTDAVASDIVHNCHYSMIIEWDPRDNIYVVTVPELRGCRTHGITYEDAALQGKDAIATWLEGAAEHGTALPSPRYFRS